MSDLLLDLCLRAGLDADYASSGNEIMLPCPTCDDHKPRLYINRRTGSWICFNCDTRGGLEWFLLSVLNIDPIKAGRYMQEIRGAEVVKPSVVQPSPSPLAPIDWPPFTMQFVKDDPEFNESRAFWEYLVARGLTPALIYHYGIRYCPMGKYAGRVVVPVEMHGTLRGWVARTIGNGEPKVLTPLGMKSAMLLFNMENVKPPHCVLVEGVFDAIRLPTQAIATLGAKLSPLQRALLAANGFTKVTMMYDADAAGRKATQHVARELVAAGFEVALTALPNGGDPGSCDMLDLQQALARAVPLSELRSQKEIAAQLNSWTPRNKE